MSLFRRDNDNDDSNDEQQQQGAPVPPPVPPYRQFTVRRYKPGAPLGPNGEHEIEEITVTAHNLNYDGPTLEARDIVEIRMTPEGWAPYIKVRRAFNGWIDYAEVPTPATSALVVG